MGAGSYERKTFDGGVVQTTLAANISDTDTAVTVADGSTFPDGLSGPFVIALGIGTSSEEKMLVSSRSTNTLTISARAYDDTVAASHTAGVTVDHILDASTIDQVNRFANLQSNRGDLVAHDGTNPQAVPVGADNEFLVADSTQTNGVAYKSANDLNLATTAYVTTAVGDEETARIAGDAALAATDINITLTGDVTGTGTITNLGDVSFATSLAANSVGSTEIAANAVTTTAIAAKAVEYDKLDNTTQAKFPQGIVGSLSASGNYTSDALRDSVTVNATNRLMMIVVQADDATQWEVRISGGGTLIRTDKTNEIDVFGSGTVRMYQQSLNTTYELWNDGNTGGLTASGVAYIVDLGPS